MHPEEFLRVIPGPPFFQIKEAAEREGEGRGAPQEPSAMSVFTSVFGVSSFAISVVTLIRWGGYNLCHHIGRPFLRLTVKNTTELIPQSTHAYAVIYWLFRIRIIFFTWRYAYIWSKRAKRRGRVWMKILCPPLPPTTIHGEMINVNEGFIPPIPHRPDACEKSSANTQRPVDIM